MLFKKGDQVTFLNFERYYEWYKGENNLRNALTMAERWNQNTIFECWHDETEGGVFVYDPITKTGARIQSHFLQPYSKP
jgi:hypothetical protein